MTLDLYPVSAEIAGEPGNFQENSPDAFHGRGGISMVVAVAVFSSLATDPMGPWEPLLVLSREWMGMGVAGMILDRYCGSFPKIPY